MRKKVNSSKVMKSISFALAVMVAGTTIMPMNVEAVEDHGYGYVDETQEQYNDTEKSNDEDAKKMEDAADQAKKSAEEASKLLDEVNTELGNAKDAAEKIQAPEQKDDNENVIKEKVDLPQEAKDAAKAAENAATEAKDTATKTEDKAESFVEDSNTYNDKVEEDQKKVDAEVKNVDGTLKVTFTDENNQEQEKALDEYVEEKKNAAEEAAKKAKEALGEALAVDTKEVNQEVKDKVAEVEKAAGEAKAAAEAAQKEYDEADEAYKKSIETFNLYAMMYGLPLYGEDKVTYSDLDVRNAGIDSRLVEQATLESQRGEILATDLTALKTTIDSQAETIQDLSKTVDAAQKAATEAQTAAEKFANGEKNPETGAADLKGLNDYVEEVKNAYGQVADHYVAPAKEAEEKAQKDLDQAKDEQETINAEQDAIIKEQEILKGQEQDKVTAKTEEKTNILNSDAYKNATATIKNGDDKANIWGTSVISRQREIQSKKKGDRVWNGYYFEKLSQKDIDNAKAYVKAYDDAKNYVNDADSKVSDLDAEIAQANANITDAENKISAANNVMQNKQAEVDVLTNNLNQTTANREAAEKVRDEYIQAASEAMSQNATGALIDEIQKELAKRSDAVNQVEFDRDLNAWANGTLEKYQDITLNWKFWETVADIEKVAKDSKAIRDYMDNHYEAHNAVIDFINYLELTQWIVSTDDTEAVMEAAIKVYRQQMKQNEEKLATIEAYLANESATSTAKSAEEALKQMAEYVEIANQAKDTLDDANKKVQEAQEAYNAAQDQLTAAKKEVEKVKFDSIKLKALSDKIKEAEDLLKQSEDNLKAAQESANLAANYNDWAQKLITDQKATAYAQKTSEGLASDNYYEYDMKDEEVASRGSGNFVQVSDSSKVVIPYDIYRSYLNSLYGKASGSYIKETNGKGISTGGSMSVVYWLMDENNKLTGDFTFDESALVSGSRYFIAYAMKAENDGYHLDGYAFDYTRSEEVVPGGEEENGGGNNGGGNNGGNNNGGNGSLTPAVLGAQRETEQTGDVLGATRVPETSGDVLGAAREGDVLGESRPQTGDDTNAWAAVAGAAVSGLLIAGYAAMKKKEEKTEEQC